MLFNICHRGWRGPFCIACLPPSAVRSGLKWQIFVFSWIQLVLGRVIFVCFALFKVDGGLGRILFHGGVVVWVAIRNQVWCMIAHLLFCLGVDFHAHHCGKYLVVLCYHFQSEVACIFFLSRGIFCLKFCWSHSKSNLFSWVLHCVTQLPCKFPFSCFEQYLGQRSIIGILGKWSTLFIFIMFLLLFNPIISI